MKEEVILVNDNDEVIGVGEKIETHFTGALHRAFSVFIFNSSGQLLLQKRASSKYHSRGLWSNTCCGHPRPGESTAEASRRRLGEEMGFDCELREVFEFIYHVEFDGGLSEHEYDHVLVGKFDGSPKLDPGEADDWRWIDLTALELDMQECPDKYTYWLRASFGELCQSVRPVEAEEEEGSATRLSNA